MRHRFHAICPYFAMFPEHFVRKNLVWSQPGDWIFDPFSGRGTTAFESLLNERRAAGCDTNPVAVCISRAKSSPPGRLETLERLAQLRDGRTLGEEHDPSEFFRLCFHPSTWGQLLYLRRSLLWQESDIDCFLAALALGCLHGESHRSGRYFSNRMPRTISTKPDYSVRWWRRHGYEPPKRDVFTILENEIEYRFFTPPPEGRGQILHGDARAASLLFPGLAEKVKLVITSPPYLDTTNFAEDQWLRLWFLGGLERPLKVRADDRHTSAAYYWKFLQEAWGGIRDLLRPDARLIIRIGGARLAPDEIAQGLLSSLKEGLSRNLSLEEQRKSEISGGQVRSFQAKARGARFEYDFHFQLG
jgi:DNA methylase